jgi:hypothetical protein
MFYIIETQENVDGTATILTYQEPTKNGALSKWHDVLYYAAISSIYLHSCVVLDSSLKTVARESYIHPETEITDE